MGKKSKVQKRGRTTTTEYWEVDFTRAFMTLKFDRKGEEQPSAGNEWLLRENPCWPKAPGYPLLTDDNWYQTANGREKMNELKKLYAKPPENDRLQMAKDSTGQNVKRGTADFDIMPLPDGNLAVHDKNSSRRISEEERKRNIQVIKCADRFCKEEIVALGGEKVVLIPGEPMPTLPVANPWTLRRRSCRRQWRLGIDEGLRYIV